MKNSLNLSFKKAEACHIEAVYEIEKESIGLWNINQFYDELTCSFSIFIIAVINDDIAAYLTAWKVSGELQVNSIAVKSGYRRNGIGIKLLNEAINLYTEVKPERIVLEVAGSNINAVNFYLSNGFKKIGTRKNCYVNENALIMEKIP
jgi:ribosomal-protein-alanine N-acetyltransferase